MVSSESFRKFLILSSLLCLLLTGCGREESFAPLSTEFPAPIATPAPTETPAAELRYDVAEFPLLPMHELCPALGYELEIESEQRVLIEGRALEYFPAGYLCFDGRYLYAPEGWRQQGDELWLEADAAVKLLNLRQEDGLVIADAGLSKLLSGGEDYYDIHFDMELTYWLPQIINAESRGQPLEGMIGVGNVVMNRMESELFPSKITSVLYEREYAIQFEPVQNGSIKAEPDEEAYIAAYLCLEGYNTVGESLYFVNPAFGSGWFDRDLQLYKAIGDHNFYVLKD